MDKSKSSNKTPDKPLKTKTSSKFLIQKVAFFGTAKKILNITQDCLLIDSLNNDPKHHEEISFKDIHAIQMSPVYEAEFNIINTKRDSTQLFCANRARCLSEIYIAWDNYIKQEHALQRKTFPTFSVSKVIIPDNHELYIDVDLVVYRTHLQLIHKSVQCPQLLKKDLIEIKDPDSVVSSVTSIPFYSIGRIYKTHKGIIIEMRYSQKQHRLLFYDLEKTNNVINIIQQNYRDYLGRQVLVSSEEMDDKIIAEIVRPNVQKLFFFNAKVYKVLESGHFFPIELAISDDFLIEYDTNTGIVIQKFDFSFVRHIIRMMSGLPGIQVIFDDFTCVTYVPLRQNRGLLASTIFTLASWKRTESATTIQDDFIHGIAPNCRLEMLGWVNNEVELDYEIDLIQKFTDPKDEAELYDSLHEFNLNGMLKTYAESDPKPLLNLINLFCKYSRVFLTQEFMSFWDVYQEYLANIYPFDFEENPHNEHERHQILVDCEKKFKQLNDTFRANYADKGISTILNVNTAPIILYKTEELLKGIIILISSHKLFREMAVNKTEQKKYENFMLDVVNLIGSPFSTLSHLAGSFFRSFCRFPTLIERKNESINKKFALTSRVKLMQNISETLAKRVLIKNEDEIGNESQFILSILACLRILKAFVYDRKDTTNPEDFQIILQYISTPYYFAIFNFLSRYRSLACVYDTTIIINSFFQHCTTRELYKSYQEKFLNNSTLILLHIKFVLSSLSVLQRKISVVLLTHLLQENSNAISLVCRIFPKNLFRKVDFMSNDISKWTLTQWELFFSLVAKNFDTPTEQWTEECREELLTKLQRIDEDINSKFNYCPPHRLHELFDPTFNHNGEFLLNIRWNHEEFEMNYEVLENKILVWKYYLKTLLEDSADAKFTVPITNPAKLWNELNIRFTGSTDDVEMILILKVMVLLYREQNSVIRDLNTMQFWLRCLVSGEYRHCRYLILQLLYTSLSVEDTSVMRFNIKKFVDIGGLKIIADVLSNIYFSEDHNNLTEEVLEKLKAESANNMDYNYTVLNIKNQAYTYSLEKSAMIKLIVNIYKSILYRPIDKTLVLDEKLLYPIPFAKYQIIEPPLIRSLMNVLLVKDDDIVLEVLEFFNEYLCDKFTFKSQTEDTPFYEFLLYNVTPKTTHARFKLALRIYQRITEDLPSEDNLIKIYANFTFQPVPPQLQEEAIQMYPLFRYLPKYMVWRLITVGSDDVTHIYWADSYETPEMIWNTEMRNHLSNCISEHIKSYRDEVIRLSEKNEITSREKVPKYTLGPAEVVHQNILDEVSVGPLRLRVWVKKEFSNYEMSPTAVSIFIEKLSALLKEYTSFSDFEATPKKLSDLLIILKGYAKAIKVYSITKYGCFKEVVSSLSHFSSRLAQEDLSKLSPNTLSEMSNFVLALCRVLFRAIRLEKSENPNLFLEANGIETVFHLLQSMLKKINITAHSEHEDYYTDLSLTFHDLKIFNLIVQILKRVFICYPSQLIVLEPEKKLQLFLNLQIVSKIPLILFELIKTKSENASNEKAEPNIDNLLYEHLLEDQFDQQFDSDTASVFDVIVSEPNSQNAEVYTSKIFSLSNNLVNLLTELSMKVDFSTAFVQSGLTWRCLEYLTYYGTSTNDKENKLNLQSTTSNLEKFCNVFRNNVIFSNEAYIWKLTGGFTSRGIGIITSKEKSAKVIQALNKIDNAEKLILANFHDCVMNILGKHILQLLLMDYYEPAVTPDEKDRSNILSFLKVYSTSLHDPATLWNAETRQELKNLLINQIFAINNSHGRLYLNLTEKFKYSLHMKHLIINDIFISLYNKTPEWKIVNPPQFLLKTMKIISDLWQNLQDLDQNPLLSDSDHNLSSVLFNLNEATAAICNVITYHGFEDVLLSEESLTQLGFLLSDKYLQRIRDPYLATLKSTCLDIFITLTNKLSGSLKILENASILQNMMELLRSNTKESSILNRKIVKILEKVADEDSFRKALINYGFFVFLLESCLKTEVHPAIYRREAFAFVIKVIKNLQVNHLLNKLILALFPYSIQEKIYGNYKVDTTLELIDAGYDTPKTMWTKLMRHEVLLLLSIEGDSIQEKWSKFEAKEIRITDNLVFWSDLNNKMIPIFPELEENIIIDHIYLKNFNKEPVFEGEDNPAVFIDNIANRALEIYNEFISKTIEYETSNKSPSQGIMSVEDQRQLDKLSCQMVTLLTSLMLSLDNFMSGIKVKEERESIKEILGQSKVDQETKTQTGGSILQDVVLISENALSFIVKCLELFNHLKVHPHILSTELQLIFVIIDNERGFGLLKSHDVVGVLAKLLKLITDTEENQSPFTFVEEKLILAILTKMGLKDQMLAQDAIEECTSSLKKLLTSNKEYLRKAVENLVAVLARNPKQGKDFFNELNKNKEVIGVDAIHNCSPKLYVQSLWKSTISPYKLDNVLKKIVQRGSDAPLFFPAISDFSVISIPHPKGENLKAEQNIKQHIARIMEEQAESPDCTHLQ